MAPYSTSLYCFLPLADQDVAPVNHFHTFLIDYLVMLEFSTYINENHNFMIND